jgi:hypothetical protein
MCYLQSLSKQSIQCSRPFWCASILVFSAVAVALLRPVITFTVSRDGVGETHNNDSAKAGSS